MKRIKKLWKREVEEEKVEPPEIWRAVLEGWERRGEWIKTRLPPTSLAPGKEVEIKIEERLAPRAFKGILRISGTDGKVRKIPVVIKDSIYFPLAPYAAFLMPRITIGIVKKGPYRVAIQKYVEPGDLEEKGRAAAKAMARALFILDTSLSDLSPWNVEKEAFDFLMGIPLIDALDDPTALRALYPCDYPKEVCQRMQEAYRKRLEQELQKSPEEMLKEMEEERKELLRELGLTGERVPSGPRTSREPGVFERIRLLFGGRRE